MEAVNALCATLNRRREGGLPSGNKAVVEGAIMGFGEAYTGWKTLGDAFQHSGIRERENRSKTVYGECNFAWNHRRGASEFSRNFHREVTRSAA